MLSLNLDVSLIGDQLRPAFMHKHTQGFFNRYRNIFHRTDIKMLTGIDHGVAGTAELKVFA
ncbi:Uncharacterised protein [Klebsiella pneumoniae]|nr:Uncharacterised protein [Klebsiella pneumoniae]